MPCLLGFLGMGTQELVIIAVIVLILFGSRLPQVMGGLGKGIRDFKKGLNAPDEEEDEDKEKPSSK
ncbi:MAG: twin-arginine translocase TatA/TatE family subunit [Pirellulales bacterium]